MIDVKATLKESEERMEMAAMYLEDQLSHVRAGRANVAILDGIRVNSYGSMVPLNQVANVSTPDPRTIAIRPWDKKMIKDIEKAIMDSDVGITPENNGEIVRLGIPQPTEERRKDLAKQCNKMGEKAKVEVRNVRGDIKDKLKKMSIRVELCKVFAALPITKILIQITQLSYSLSNKFVRQLNNERRNSCQQVNRF